MKQEFDSQQTRRVCVQVSSSYHHIPLPFTMQGSIIVLLLITAGHRIGQNNTKLRNEEHMFIITNNCNPGYFKQNAIIDNLRTEVLSMNERRLIYRRLINHLAYLSMMLILISTDVVPLVARIAYYASFLPCYWLVTCATWIHGFICV